MKTRDGICERPAASIARCPLLNPAHLDIHSNQVLAKRGAVVPRAKKTGTTIVAVIYKDGVVLGADTRATEGDTVADKNCEKIHYIADNIWCCGAGTSADTENTTMLISSQLELHRMATGKQPRVVTACTMLKRMLFRYQGHVSAALVLGGMDCNGPSLYTVRPQPTLVVPTFCEGSDYIIPSPNHASTVTCYGVSAEFIFVCRCIRMGPRIVCPM